MNKIGTYESFVWKAFYQKLAVENKYNAMMQELMSSATSNRVNEWLVEQRWDVVDNQAVQNANQVANAMMSVEGMGEDSVKSIAQLVGADIFVVYDMNEINSGGGYKYEFSLKAFDSTTGQLKSSKVSTSNNQASPDPSVGEKKAVNRAMPDVLMQIQRARSNT
jgi:hypothetical protein